MELGFIGLGRMGMNMVIRLVRGGHRVVVYNRSPEKVREADRARRSRRGVRGGPGRAARAAAGHLGHGAAGRAPPRT